MDERHAHRVMGENVFPRQVILLGNPGTKRTIYLGHAARELGLHVLFLDWKQWMAEPEELRKKKEKGDSEVDGLFSLFPEGEPGETYMKIDPPQWDSCDLGRQPGLVREFKHQLGELSRLSRALSQPSASSADGQDGQGQSAGNPLYSAFFQSCGQSVRRLEFFNHPEEIAALLDKESCKRRLMEEGLPVTEFLVPEGPAGQRMNIRDGGQLLEEMREQRVFQVFLKPVYGSGAAGVGAFRFQPGTGKMALYTCALPDPAGPGLVNTKKLRCFREPGQVRAILNQLLALGCVVERWYAKAEHQGFSYDLRAVIQEGRMDFLLARLSKGPVTNLHLNNHPLEAEALGLTASVLEEVEELCRRAALVYPRLSSVGIDVLLEKGSLKPRVIEMNGQGDLIYQDIYGQNRIYRHQAEMMKRWRKKECQTH